MANRPFNNNIKDVLDTSSSSSLNINPDAIHDSSMLMMSSASYGRRIVSSSSSVVTPTCSPSSSHCLRIFCLRHDPVHFIPALFAQLNLPPPASIWTQSDDYYDPVRGFGHEPNSSVHWFMYHDALAVRFHFILFYFGGTAFKEILCPPRSHLRRLNLKSKC